MVKKGSRPQVLQKIKRLFVIKNRFEAYLIIFALALGAMTRGAHYTEIYPGPMGYVLMAATAGAVFLGGAKILDCLRYEREAKAAEIGGMIPVTITDVELRRSEEYGWHSERTIR